MSVVLLVAVNRTIADDGPNTQHTYKQMGVLCGTKNRQAFIFLKLFISCLELPQGHTRTTSCVIIPGEVFLLLCCVSWCHFQA